MGLPQLTAGIPATLLPTSGQRQVARLARCLLDAGVIHGSVPACRAREPLATCQKFLEAWVRKQVAGLKCLSLDFRLLLGNDDMGGNQRPSGLPLLAEPGRVTILWFTQCQQLSVGAALERLEEVRPALGATVLSVIDRISLKLIPAFTPWDALSIAREHYWYGEEDESTALDENCADDPGERAAMQQQMVTRAKIDAAFPAWATTWAGKRKRIARRELRQIAVSARGVRVREVAYVTLALDRLDLDDSFLPDMDGAFLGYGPVLSWTPDDITVRVFDDYANDAAQGEFFDWIGEFSFDVNAVRDSQALRHWMAAMTARLDGVRLLDTLIHELSTGDWRRVPKGFRCAK